MYIYSGPELLFEEISEFETLQAQCGEVPEDVFACHFPQKSPIINGSVAETDLQLKAFYASLPPCSKLEAFK